MRSRLSGTNAAEQLLVEYPTASNEVVTAAAVVTVINVVMGTLIAWVLVRDESLLQRSGGFAQVALHLRLVAQPPREYPDNGLYHPRLASRMTESISELPRPGHVRGTIGLVIMRSYVLAGDSGHYDSVIEKLEARGLRKAYDRALALDPGCARAWALASRLGLNGFDPQAAALEAQEILGPSVKVVAALHHVSSMQLMPARHIR